MIWDFGVLRPWGFAGGVRGRTKDVMPILLVQKCDVVLT